MIKMSSTITVLICGLSLAPVFAQNPTSEPPTRKPLAPERLVMPLFPAGWTEVYRDNGAVEVVEYLPEGQSVNNWLDKIQLQVYNELNELPLDAIQRRMQGLNRNRCTGVIEGLLQSLDLPADVSDAIRAITPANYIGEAEKLVHRLLSD